MRKFGLVLLVMMTIGSAIFMAMLSSGGDRQGPAADPLRERVISVALADPIVQHFRNISYENIEPEYIGPGETGTYINDSTRYAGVSFHANAGGEPVSLKVIVDTTTMSETGLFYGGVPPFTNSWLIIPPGNGIYEEMDGGFNLSTPNRYAIPEIASYGYYHMNVTPADAGLYPIIVDEANLRMYLNGSHYDTPELIDPATHERVKVNGSKPVTTEWYTRYILPPEVQSYTVSSGINTKYYLILANRDDWPVKIVYGSPFSPMYE